MKVCTKCKQLKDDSCFVKNNKSKDGLSWWCKDCKKEHNKNNYDKILAYRKNRPNYDKEYYKKHSEDIKYKKKLYRQNNAEKIRQAEIDYYKKHKLSRNFSKAICFALKGMKSGQHWETLIPYNLQQLKEHLESQFDENMNWDNYGDYWEIDHIIPQNLFNITTVEDEQFQVCWSLANLRPLEKSVNRSRPKDGRDIPKEIKSSILKR